MNCSSGTRRRDDGTNDGYGCGRGYYGFASSEQGRSRSGHRRNCVPNRLARSEIGVPASCAASAERVIASKGVERAYDDVLPVVAVGIYVAQRVVQGRGVLIPTLRIFHQAGEHLRVRTGKPPLRPGEVPRPRVIEARLPISFFAGELKAFSLGDTRKNPTRRRPSVPQPSQFPTEGTPDCESMWPLRSR